MPELLPHPQKRLSAGRDKRSVRSGVEAIDQRHSSAPPVITEWETDTRGQNHYQSPSWYSYVGEGPASSHGENWLQFYHPDDRAKLLREWYRALAGNGAYPYDIEVRIRRHDGVFHWFRVTARPIRDVRGLVTRWRGICAEIKDRPGVRGAPRVAPRRRVLIVDDNRESADSMALVVKTIGHDAAVAYDGHAGLALARKFGPDLAFLDLAMPGLDGYQLARALRAEFPALRMIAVSGFGQEADRARSRDCGFDLHFVKPIDPEFIESLLGRR